SISSLRILARDRRGQPLPGVLAEAPRTGAPKLAIPGGQTPANEVPSLVEISRIEFYPASARLSGVPRLEGLSRLGVAEAFELLGMRERAGAQADNAVAVLPDEPLVKLAWLYWIGRNPLY